MSHLHALNRKNRCYWRNTGRIFREQSRFKVMFIAAFAIVLEGGLAALFYDGFRFLSELGGAGTVILNRLFALFFLAVGIMTVISSFVITYSTMFRSQEVPYLLTSPFTLTDIVTYKFLESAVLCSWSFFFIMVPFLAAYAIHEHLSFAFALWNLLFSIPFLGLCAGIGSSVTILVVRWFPRRNRIARTVLLLLVLSAVLIAYLKTWSAGSEDQLQFNLSALLPGLSLATSKWMPSWWVAEGVMSLVRNDWWRGVMLFAVTAANAMLALLIVQEIGQRVFWDTWQLVSFGTGLRSSTPALFTRLRDALQILRPDVRGLVLKDIRTFFRDPMQWSQTLIFFGILAFYFANLRSFRYHLFPDAWRNTIAFLNVFSVAAVMCSLGSRFVYPQLSLEGQAFWTIGLSPLTPVRVLLTKFLTALAGLLPVGVALMALSSTMLRADSLITALAILMACCLASATTGLSTGLGAIYMDLHQRNPAAIVSGFGGTLNLVLNLVVMLATIVPLGALLHLRNTGILPDARFHMYLAATVVWLISVTLASTIVPLVLGSRSLREREF